MPRVTAGERVTYRSVLSNRELRALLAGEALSVLGDQVARIAIAVMVYQRTQSPLAASATYAVSFFGYLLFGPFVSTLADRWTRRTIMVVADLARAGLMLVLAVHGIPLPALFALLVLLSGIAPAFETARSATLPDVLVGEAYAQGQALLNITFQAAQVLGFVTGGALLAALSVSQLLVLDAATFLLSAGLVLGTLLGRPPVPDGVAGKLLTDVRAGLAVVLGDPPMRRLLAFGLLGAAAVSAPEGLAVAITADLGGGALAVGVLTAAIPAGFVVASTVVLRLPAERRLRLMMPLSIVSAVPLILTPMVSSVPGTIALWLVCGLGTSLQLVASTAFGQAVPAHARARAFGIAGSALMATQGAAQLAVGALADVVGARTAVSAFACVVLLALLLLREQPVTPRATSQEIRDLVRRDTR
jgi:MFS family permease